MVPPQKKKLQIVCFYWYLQCFNNILADFFKGINFEGCAWFWDHVFVHMLLTHCYSSLFWQQYIVGFLGDDMNTHIHIQ